MGHVELRAVSVVRDGEVLLDAVDVAVGDGERLAVLGPSGSGKTTLLRVVAGVQTADRGTVRIAGRDVTHAPARDRDVGMVDQAASLQPHLDVRRNVGFPLALRRVGRRERDARVEAEARAFSLRGMLRRRPNQISTGQRHEVALARSLVRRVGVLLLDEPFARTDPPRRTVLLRELVRVQEGYGVTLIAATNDQRVAMGLAHRCVVLDGGRVVQIGPPTELHARPANRFVAGFVGTPPMNFLPGRVERAASGVRVVAGPLRIRSFSPLVADLAGHGCVVGVRPTDLRAAGHDETITIEEVVRQAVSTGPAVEVQVGEPDAPLTASLAPPAPRLGALLRLAADPADIHLFDTTGAARAHGV